MTEKVSINLDRTYLLLRITGIVAGALIACAVVYGQFDSRVDANALAVATERAEREKQLIIEKLEREKQEAVQKARVDGLVHTVNGMNSKMDKIYELMLEKANRDK